MSLLDSGKGKMGCLVDEVHAGVVNKFLVIQLPIFPIHRNLEFLLGP